jgi:hypothetical protein
MPMQPRPIAEVISPCAPSLRLLIVVRAIAVPV